MQIDYSHSYNYNNSNCSYYCSCSCCCCYYHYCCFCYYYCTCEDVDDHCDGYRRCLRRNLQHGSSQDACHVGGQASKKFSVLASSAAHILGGWFA